MPMAGLGPLSIYLLYTIIAQFIFIYIYMEFFIEFSNKLLILLSAISFLSEKVYWCPRLFRREDVTQWAKKNADDLLNRGELTSGKTAVKEALQDGRKLPGAVLRRSQSLIIK